MRLPACRTPLATAALAAALLAASGSAACGSRGESARDSARAAAPAVAAKPMNPDPAANTYAPALGVTLAQFKKRPSGLYVRDDTVGKGAVATKGRDVLVDYTGYLTDGTMFDTSKDRGKPFAFTLGQGDVVAGWDEGIEGMHVGGSRTLVVPAAMGYGPGGQPGIPGNAVLVFRVKLVGMGMQ